MTEQQTLNWLRQHPTATVATISKTKKPELSVVYTYVDNNFHCYFVTKESTRKHTNLSGNKDIALSWCHETNLTMCEMAGEAFLVHDGETVAYAITQLQGQLVNGQVAYWTPPVGQINNRKHDHYVVYKVIPRMVSYTDYSSAGSQNPEPRKFAFLP